MTKSLPQFEVITYFIIWIGGVIYCVSSVYWTGKEYYNWHTPGEDFVAGWSWFEGRFYDLSDYEFSSWTVFLLIVGPWLCIHLSISLFTKFIFPEAVNTWYILIGFLFLSNYIGPTAGLTILLQPCIFYILRQTGEKNVIWCASLIFLTSMVYFNKFVTSYWSVSTEEAYMFELAMYWMHLKCLSFSLDHDSYSLVQCLAYCSYLPTLFLGPHITVHHFYKKSSSTYSTRIKLLNFSFEISRYIFWLFFVQLVLHFIYVNAFQLQIHFIENLNGWTMNGLGFCMGQYFHMKYVVFYGISTAIARCEDIAAPPIPKCVARIHKYSDMWRHFDRGLYLFLTRYLYHPWCGENKSLLCRLSGSLLCFTFIWLWHGPTHLYICVWCILNFIGISIEAICKELYQTTIIRNIKSKLSGSNVERIEGVLATPLTIMSIMSNIYFFGGMEVGNAYIRYILSGGWRSTVIFIYSLRHVSVTIEHWEEKKKMR